eukprot:UN00590
MIYMILIIFFDQKRIFLRSQKNVVKLQYIYDNI